MQLGALGVLVANAVAVCAKSDFRLSYTLEHTGYTLMPDETSLPLLKGTLDLLILKTLSWGPMHGYAIASWLEQRSDGELGVDDSALYQALQRMETRELITAEWGVTNTGRKARFYRLTTRGRQHLKAEAATWVRYTSSVSSILALASRAPKEA